MTQNPDTGIELSNVVALDPRDARTLDDLRADPFSRSLNGQDKLSLNELIPAIAASVSFGGARKSWIEYDRQIQGREAPAALEQYAQEEVGTPDSFLKDEEIAIGAAFFREKNHTLRLYEGLKEGRLKPADIFVEQVERAQSDDQSHEDLGQVAARYMQLENTGRFHVRNQARKAAREGDDETATTLYEAVLKHSQENGSTTHQTLYLESLLNEFSPTKELALNLASQTYRKDAFEAKRIVDAVVGSDKIWRYRQEAMRAQARGEEGVADVVSTIIMHKVAQGEVANARNSVYLTARENKQSRAVALELATNLICGGEYENAQPLISGVQEATLQDDLLFENAGSKQSIQVTARQSGKDSRLYTVMASVSDMFYSSAKYEKISNALDTLGADKSVSKTQLATVLANGAAQYITRGNEKDQERANLLVEKAYNTVGKVDEQTRQTTLSTLFSEQVLGASSYARDLASYHLQAAREQGRFGEARAIEKTVTTYVLHDARAKHEDFRVDEAMNLYENVLEQNPQRASDIFSEKHLKDNARLIQRGLEYATNLYEQGEHELADQIEANAIAAIESVSLSSARRALYEEVGDLFIPEDTFTRRDTGVLPFVQVTRRPSRNNNSGAHVIGTQLYEQAA